MSEVASAMCTAVHAKTQAFAKTQIGRQVTSAIFFLVTLKPGVE